jgi:hypothetical protein
MGKKSRSGIWIRDKHPRSYFRKHIIFGLKLIKFFDVDPESGIFLILDPGWKNADLG